jgi:hypothetical protein
MLVNHAVFEAAIEKTERDAEKWKQRTRQTLSNPLHSRRSTEADHLA